jgi:glucose 1-dehydrogenase
MSFSPSLLKGQKALVTGASSGIGEAIARALAAAGASVAVNYHSEAQAAQKIVEDIKAQGAEAIALGADVSKEDEVKAMFGQMFEEFGTIDILVNNAGMQKDSPFTEMTLEHWNQVKRISLALRYSLPLSLSLRTSVYL